VSRDRLQRRPDNSHLASGRRPQALPLLKKTKTTSLLTDDLGRSPAPARTWERTDLKPSGVPEAYLGTRRETNHSLGLGGAHLETDPKGDALRKRCPLSPWPETSPFLSTTSQFTSTNLSPNSTDLLLLSPNR